MSSPEAVAAALLEGCSTIQDIEQAAENLRALAHAIRLVALEQRLRDASAKLPPGLLHVQWDVAVESGSAVMERELLVFDHSPSGAKCRVSLAALRDGDVPDELLEYAEAVGYDGADGASQTELRDLVDVADEIWSIARSAFYLYDEPAAGRVDCPDLPHLVR